MERSLIPRCFLNNSKMRLLLKSNKKAAFSWKVCLADFYRSLYRYLRSSHPWTRPSLKLSKDSKRLPNVGSTTASLAFGGNAPSAGVISPAMTTSPRFTATISTSTIRNVSSNGFVVARIAVPYVGRVLQLSEIFRDSLLLKNG